MSEHPEPQTSGLDEDPKLARVLGLVLFLVIPLFCFYVGSVFGKDWHYDYQTKDIYPGLVGAGVGLVVAFGMNLYIWIKYRKQSDADYIHEWFEPQAHKSSDHH